MSKSKGITFQVRMDKSLKILADEKAREYGFGSAQNMTKFLLKAVLDDRIRLGLLEGFAEQDDIN